MKSEHKIKQNSYKRSEFHPLLKFFALILIISGIMIYPSWRLSTVLFITVLLVLKITAARFGIGKNRLRFLIIFALLMFLIQVLVTVNGSIVLFLVPQVGSVGPFVPVTDYGIERGLTISVRFLLIVFSSMLFVTTTDPTLLAHSFTMLRIPYRYSFSLVIALRFLPLFDTENQIVRMTQRSRGISPDVRGLSKMLRTVRYTFFPLLVSALSRVESLTLSMEGRGFGSEKTRTYLRKSRWHFKDSIALFLIAGFVVLCLFLAMDLLPNLAIYL